MGFTETTFLFVFLPVSVLLYISVDKAFHNTKLNNAILIILSIVFYFWANKEAMVFFALIGLFIFIAGQMIEKKCYEQQDSDKNRIRLTIIVLIGVLFFYKYISLVAVWINDLVNKDLINITNLIVPIGLSFIVFESISYLVDIYRGDAEAGSLLDCFTFISLFPKIVSGPIVLWKDFKPQLNERHSTGEQISAGIDRIIIGYAKKAIIADTFGMQIALINTTPAIDVPTVWLKALLYSFQLYFDFSGYSDIAIGICKIFGFSIKENFNYPYLSKSITEFWRRWHISLGAWFREYVYIPLGGNRRGNVYIHLLIVFILTGLWHGTGFQFLAWGGVHGIIVLIERAIRDKKWYKNTPNCIKWFLTIVCVYFAWIMFMSNDLTYAIQTYKSMFIPMTTDTVNFTWRYYLSNRTLLFLIVAIVGHLFGLEKIRDKMKQVFSTNGGDLIKKLLLLLLFVIDILYVVNSTYSPFIYFQF